MPQSHRQQGTQGGQQAAAEQAGPLHRACRILGQEIDETGEPDKGGVAGEVGGELQHAKARHPVGEVQGIVGIERHGEGQEPAYPDQLQQEQQPDWALGFIGNT
ncbi:hypothetical protein D3C79_812840 [compost metagenome]